MSVASEFNKESAGPVEPSSAGGQALTGLDFSGRWAVPLGAAALALLCLVTYYPLQKGAFIWDDRQWLLVNSFVHHWKGLKFIWFKLSASHAPGMRSLRSTHQSNRALPTCNSTLTR